MGRFLIAWVGLRSKGGFLKVKKLVMMVLLSIPCLASWTFVNCQGATTTTSVSSLSTSNWSSTTGDMVACAVATFTQTLSSVSDVNGKSFTITAVQNSPATSHQYVAYGFLISANASYHVTATPNTSSNQISIACAEFTPPAGTAVSLDNKNSTSISGTTPTVTVSAVTAGDLVIGAATADSNLIANAAGSGYTIPTNGQQPSNMDTVNHQPTEIEYNLSATGGSTVVNFGAFTGSGAAIWGIAFKAVSLGGCANHTLPMAGAGPC